MLRRRSRTRRIDPEDSVRAELRLRALGRAPVREVRVGGWTPNAAQGAGVDPASARGSDPHVAAEHPYVEEVALRALMSSRRAPRDTLDGDDAPTVEPTPGSSGVGSPGRVGEVAEAIATAWALRRGHVVAVAAILLLAVIGVGVMVIRDRPVRESVDDSLSRASMVSGAPSPSTAVGVSASPSPSPAVLVVHVAGKVRKPGVIRLPPGSRVVDAVSAAGGALPGVDLSALNLARPLSDGEQVLVGVTPAAPTAGSVAGAPQPAGQPGASGSAGLVDLNTATAEVLEGLPGVGPVLAQRILEFRTAHGRFSSVDELQDVTGIGERKFADLKPRVTAS